MKISILAVPCALLAMTLGALGCESGPTTVTSVQLSSPNGRMQISVASDSEGRMSYTVSLETPMARVPS
jgi:hypothetical protein